MDREIIAVDNEKFQLDFLKQRAQKLEDSTMDNWSFCLLKYPKEDVPDKIYSLIIFSDFLHFFSLKECIEIIGKIQKNSTKGTLIYVKVHSHKFYANNPNAPDNNDYFKHYFTPEDLETIFKKEKFEKIYFAEIEKVCSSDEQKLINKCADEYLKQEGIANQKEKEAFKADFMKNINQSYIVAILEKSKNCTCHWERMTFAS